MPKSSSPPPVLEIRDGVKVEVKHAVMAWVCSAHQESVESNRGWQEREKGKSRRITREAKRRFEKTQMELG